MPKLDMTTPNTRRRLQAAYHGFGCTQEHGFPDCPNPADIATDVDDFLTGMRRFGPVIEVEKLSDKQLAEAWHYGCRSIGIGDSEHPLIDCDDLLRDHILLDEVPNIVRPMLNDVSF